MNAPALDHIGCRFKAIDYPSERGPNRELATQVATHVDQQTDDCLDFEFKNPRVIQETVTERPRTKLLMCDT